MAFFSAPNMPFDGVHFEAPIFVAPHRRARECCSSSSSSPCCAGGRLLKLAMLILLLPSIMRMGCFLFCTFMSIFFTLAGIASIAILLRSMFSTNDTMLCPMMMSRRGATCTAKKGDSTATCAAKKDNSTATGGAATAAAATISAKRLDLSSVQYVVREDEDQEHGTLMTLVIAAPGVRAADLTVSAVDRYLLIKGESSKECETFCIDRRILVPQGADLDTISATHAEGILKIVVGRKVPKRIAVGVAPRMAAAAGRGSDTVQPAVGASRSNAAATDTQEEFAQHGRELEQADPDPLPLDEWEEAVPLARAPEKKHE